jgi:hypothetical protein
MYMGEVKELYRGRNTWERKNKESGSRQDSHWQRTAFSDVEVEVLWLQLVESRRAIPAATHTHTHAHTIIGENVEGKIKKNSFLFCSVRALSPEDLDISKRNTRSPLQELVLSILTRQPAVR